MDGKNFQLQRAGLQKTAMLDIDTQVWIHCLPELIFHLTFLGKDDLLRGHWSEQIGKDTIRRGVPTDAAVVRFGRHRRRWRRLGWQVRHFFAGAIFYVLFQEALYCERHEHVRSGTGRSISPYPVQRRVQATESVGHSFATGVNFF